MVYQKTELSYACSLRRAFVDKFVDRSLRFYRYSMGHGDFYGSGSHRNCLWETFKDYNVISRPVALRIIESLPEVFVTWDNSPATISRKLQKSRMIQMSGSELFNALQNTPALNVPQNKRSYFPSDIYVFTPDLSFYVAFTHQYIKGIGNICLTSIKNLSDNGIPKSFQGLFQCFQETQIAN